MRRNCSNNGPTCRAVTAWMPELAAGIEAELIIDGIIPRAHQNPEIRRRLFAEQIFAGGYQLPVRRCAAANRGPASARPRGRPDGRSRIPAPPATCARNADARGNASILRPMGVICNRSRPDGVPPSLIFGLGELPTIPHRFQRPQIQQQFLRVRERNFVRFFQPAETSQVLHAGGLERQHDFGQIEPFDFRQFLRRALVVFRPRPKPGMQRPGAVRPARPARWSALAWLIFSISSVLMPRLAS